MRSVTRSLDPFFAYANGMFLTAFVTMETLSLSTIEQIKEELWTLTRT